MSGKKLEGEKREHMIQKLKDYWTEEKREEQSKRHIEWWAQQDHDEISEHMIQGHLESGHNVRHIAAKQNEDYRAYQREYQRQWRAEHPGYYDKYRKNRKRTGKVHTSTKTKCGRAATDGFWEILETLESAAKSSAKE